MTYVGSDSPPWPFCSRASTYVVIDPRTGAGLPPKLVLTTAAYMASPDRRHTVFSGGQHTNRKLTELGFVVVEKASLHSAPGHADPVGA